MREFRILLHACGGPWTVALHARVVLLGPEHYQSAVFIYGLDGLRMDSLARAPLLPRGSSLARAVLLGR